MKAAGYATAPDYAQRLCRIIEEAQLFLLDQPDGERLYASRSGRKITDPEGWFTDQTSMERPGRRIVGRRSGQLPRDDQRPQRLQRLCRPTACTTCWPRRTTRSRTSGGSSASRRATCANSTT
ncbi:MAG: hypothetical protein ACLUYV_00370 [Alistipes shahii]